MCKRTTGPSRQDDTDLHSAHFVQTDCFQLTHTGSEKTSSSHPQSVNVTLLYTFLCCYCSSPPLFTDKTAERCGMSVIKMNEIEAIGIVAVTAMMRANKSFDCL